GWYSEPWWKTALVAGAWGVGSFLLFDALFSGMDGSGYADGFQDAQAMGAGDFGGGDMNQGDMNQAADFGDFGGGDFGGGDFGGGGDWGGGGGGDW
ncbi:MAG: hypothetical protein QOG76_3341, partial [Pseudonocardiales bacterium]|nr:hypothetical protein [Pseudonocardiales bacterium]